MKNITKILKFAIILVVIILIGYCSFKNETKQDNPKESSKGIGDIVTLYDSEDAMNVVEYMDILKEGLEKNIDNPVYRTIPVYRTYTAYKKMGDAAVIGVEEYKYVHAELIMSGEKFYVKSGTRAMILDIKVFSEAYQIRILDGSKEGLKVWVSQGYARKNG